MLHERAQSLNIEGHGRFVDLNAWFQHASSFPRLTELSLAPPGRLYTALWAFNPAHIPIGLTSLSLRFAHCAWVFTSSLDLPTVTPHLKLLHLEDQPSSSVQLSTLKLPSGLTSLSLDMKVFIAQGDIARLPRSLTALKLMRCRELEEHSLPLQFEQGDWMPSLTSLSMTTTGIAGLPLYALPRGLKRLAIDENCTLWISNRYSVGILNFPFRSFFPVLESLSLHPLYSVDLALLVNPTLLDTEEYDHVARLASHFPANPQPCWKILDTRITLNRQQLAEEYISQLSSVERLEAFPVEAKSLQPYFPGLTDFECPFLELRSTNLTLPSRITKLNVGSIHVGDIPPTLTWLRARISLVLATPTTRFPAQSLTFLKTNGPFTEELAAMLPLSIEELVISFNNTSSLRPNHQAIKLRSDLSPLLCKDSAYLSTDDWSAWMTSTDVTWKILAERFLRLRALTILHGDGFPTMALAPLKSTHFESITLISTASSVHMAWLACLFDGMNTAGRPAVLPPTTRSVSLQLTGGLPLCIIPMLPRSLKSFHTTAMNAELLPNFPFDPAMSPSDMLVALPPKLEDFNWSPLPIGSKPIRVTSYSILSWPRTLRVLHLPAQFLPDVSGNSKDARSNELASLLPPCLGDVSWAVNEQQDPKLLSAYMQLQGRTTLSHNIMEEWKRNKQAEQ